MNRYSTNTDIDAPAPGRSKEGMQQYTGVMKAAVALKAGSKLARSSPDGKRQSALLKGYQIDTESGVSVSEQIVNALAENMVRVIDLFREWDTNGDGTVDRSEFRKALFELGLYCPQQEVDALFDTWDTDSSGVFEIEELKKTLSRKAKPGLHRGDTMLKFTKSKNRLAEMDMGSMTPRQLQDALVGMKQETEMMENDHVERLGPSRGSNLHVSVFPLCVAD